MSTRGIVPRADGEGYIGTAAKKWGNIQVKKATVEEDISSGSIKTDSVIAESVTIKGDLSVSNIKSKTMTVESDKRALHRKTSYNVGDVVYFYALSGVLYFECTTAGTTGTDEPDVSSITTGGKTVNDGTAVFTTKTVCAKEYVDALRTDMDKSKEEWWKLLPKTAAAHNSIYRGKDLTSYFNSGAMSKAIAAGTFDDIFPGDYIIKSVTINGTAYNNVKWLVADLDYHYDRGYKNQDVHHVVLIPENNLGTARMNATNTTAGGYQKSEMFKTTLPKYTTGIVAAFGTDHVLEHSELLTNNMNANAASAAGAGWMGSAYWDWNGKDGATDGSYPWRHDIKVNICNQAMMYGNHPFASSGQEEGDFNKQLAIFRYGKNFTRTYWCWLRDVANAGLFALANNDGYAYTTSASIVGGVRPYFLLR